MTRSKQTPAANSGTRRISMDRLYNAPMEDVWDLWTTKDGLESWWGPDGFRVEVRSLDLRPGGQLKYAMVAHAPEQVEFMKASGMPLVTLAQLTYSEVIPNQRLAYDHQADFIPGVTPYAVSTVVTFQQTPKGVKMALQFDAMHDDVWTERQTMGWASQLGKLDRLLGL